MNVHKWYIGCLAKKEPLPPPPPRLGGIASWKTLYKRSFYFLVTLSSKNVIITKVRCSNLSYMLKSLPLKSFFSKYRRISWFVLKICNTQISHEVIPFNSPIGHII